MEGDLKRVTAGCPFVPIVGRLKLERLTQIVQRDCNLEPEDRAKAIILGCAGMAELAASPQARLLFADKDLASTGAAKATTR